MSRNGYKQDAKAQPNAESAEAGRACLWAMGLLLGWAVTVSGGPPSEVVEFRSAVLPRETDTSVSAQASREVLRAFVRDHPHIRIDPFVIPQIEGASMDTGPLMGIASGQPPHAMYINFRQSSSFINHGFLEPLEVLLARLPEFSDDPAVRQTDEAGNWLADPSAQQSDNAREQIRQRVIDRVWPVIHRRADVQRTGVPEGEHVWAIPTSTLVRALLYRKDVFQEAGLDPDRPPENWDELREFARRIHARPNRIGIMIGGGPSISWKTYSFMVSNGVRYMEQDESGRWRASFNTPAAAESIYYVLQLAKQPYEMNGRTHTGAASVATGNLGFRWDRGEVGMRFAYLERQMMASINPELVGIAPVPQPVGGEPSGELNAQMVGVFSGCTPEQKLAVMRYIWFLTGEQAERIRVRVMVEYGYGRFVNPDLLEKFGYDDILRKVPASWRKTFDQAMKYGVPEPYGKNTQFIYTKVSEPINWALQNEQLLDLPREQALARLEDRLDSAAERVDRYMLGKLTPEQWRFRRIVGTIALCLIIGLFGGSLYYVWRAFTKAEVTSDRRPSLWRFAPAYLMLAPALAIVLLWQYLPVIMSLPLALCDYELVIASEFVGIDNFATVLFDERFWASLARTCYYVLLVVGLGFWPPIFVAILLDEVPTAGAKYFFRTVFYLPAIVSGVIMVFLWLQLYQPDEDGVLNQIILLVNHLGPVGGTLTKLLLLGAWLGLIGLVLSMVFHLRELTVPVRLGLALFGLGLLLATIWPLVEAYLGPTEVQAAAMIQQGVNPTDHQGLSAVFGALSHLVGRWNLSPLRWVEDPALAMVCVVIPGIWAHAGPGCIIYLAALKTVPDELVEAATIDGAGILQKIAYITLPRIKFLILIQLVGAIVSAFKGGTNFILAMTGGGPQTPTGGATKVLGMDIFERTFMELNYGVGAAMAWLLGGLVIIVTAYQLKRISRAEFKTADTAKENPGGTPYTAPAGAR